MFNIHDISPQLQHKMLTTGVWREQGLIKISDLKLIEVIHYDFANQVQIGELVVLSEMAVNFQRIFKELFKIRFPIAKIKTIDCYKGDDEASMEDNNSSCFCYRNIGKSDKLSIHSYGLAIDINPEQNPMIQIDEVNGRVEIYPKNGVSFLNRHNLRPGMVEPVIDIFKNNGLECWGGNWNNPIDYHHFQVSKSRLELEISKLTL